MRPVPDHCMPLIATTPVRVSTVVVVLVVATIAPVDRSIGAVRMLVFWKYAMAVPSGAHVGRKYSLLMGSRSRSALPSFWMVPTDDPLPELARVRTKMMSLPSGLQDSPANGVARAPEVRT